MRRWSNAWRNQMMWITFCSVLVVLVTPSQWVVNGSPVTTSSVTRDGSSNSNQNVVTSTESPTVVYTDLSLSSITSQHVNKSETTVPIPAPDSFQRESTISSGIHSTLAAPSNSSVLADNVTVALNPLLPLSSTIGSVSAAGTDCSLLNTSCSTCTSNIKCAWCDVDTSSTNKCFLFSVDTVITSNGCRTSDTFWAQCAAKNNILLISMVVAAVVIIISCIVAICCCRRCRRNRNRRKRNDEDRTAMTRRATPVYGAPPRPESISTAVTPPTGPEIDSSSHNQCSICFDADANAAVNPCGHVMCYSCASEQLQQSRTCPMCRGTIETILRLYTN